MLPFRYTALALLVAWPVTLPAQATIAMGLPHATSSCVEHLPPSAFTRVAVYAFVDLSDPVGSHFAASADNLLQELAFRAHSLLGVAPERLPEGEPRVGWRGIDAPLHLTAFRDGRIVSRDTTAGTAAALMAQALTNVATVGLLDWTADSARDSVRFDVREFSRVRETSDTGTRVRAGDDRRMRSESARAHAICF